MRTTKECHIRRFLGIIVPLTFMCTGFLVSSAAAQPQAPSNLDIRLVTDEADAVMFILKRMKVGEPVAAADWDRLFSTEGYVRLKKRESELKRSFEDAEFQKFVLSSELLAKTGALAETLELWKRADMRAAATRALAYLPAGTAIRAKVYPVIKPKTNSFVFELETDPAIFLYLNPDMNSAQFENTVAHELHHIGLAAACLPVYESEEFKKRPAEVRTVLEWIGAFGEGVAMLAAAGGPDVHPHAASPAPDRERWDKDMANFNADQKKVEAFFLDVLDGRLKEEAAIREVAFSFFGIQGPWYTVGWKMAELIEETFGRAKLIDCLCDPVALLVAYNEAAAMRSSQAGEALALWSPELLKRLN
ncbi:MAG TPA: hypothetical protein DIW61_09490 [Candidatus Aminicenantes bacterium]|nr:hypothetical protein [Candidatus Aminicenantes bacterium]